MSFPLENLQFQRWSWEVSGRKVPHKGKMAPQPGWRDVAWKISSLSNALLKVSQVRCLQKDLKSSHYWDFGGFGIFSNHGRAGGERSRGP